MEVRPTASPRHRAEIGAELDRIEGAVGRGERDLAALGFWRLVKQVKLDRALVEAHADQIGRIDGAAFRAGVSLRAPVWVGNGVLMLGTVVGAVAVGAAFVWQTQLWKGIALVAAGAIWSVSVHSPMHWLVGYIVGIRFTDYFLGGPPPPRPGLKSDYGTYLRADAGFPGVDACVGCGRDQARSVRRPRLLACVERTLVVGGGPRGDRPRPDRDRHRVEHHVERLEEVPAGEGHRPRAPRGADARIELRRARAGHAAVRSWQARRRPCRWSLPTMGRTARWAPSTSWPSAT